MGDVRMGKMANTDVGMGDLCQTISDAHCCCDGIYSPLYTIATCCGRRRFRPTEYVSTDVTDVWYTPTVGGGVTLWVMPITGPGCTCQYSCQLALHNGRSSWAERPVRLSSLLLISPTHLDLWSSDMPDTPQQQSYAIHNAGAQTSSSQNAPNIKAYMKIPSCHTARQIRGGG